MQLGRSRNRDDPRLLREQPCERDLRWCSLLLPCDPFDHIHERLVGPAVLLAETRNHVSEVLAVELRVLIDLAREETFAQRRKRYEADAELLQYRYYFLF